MKITPHLSSERGFVNLGWLKSFHSFSFGSYYNPKKIHFGTLRVLNDDEIDPNNGFGMHPHENMEIITIPLSGELTHRDNMGNESKIVQGEIQVMSAGTGIIHSEFNYHKTKKCTLLQIWLFPNRKDVEPRYQQQSIDISSKENVFHQILSPNKNDDGVWIHQNAWFFLGKFNKTQIVTHCTKKPNNGLYIFVVDGEMVLENKIYRKKDAVAIQDCSSISLQVINNAHVLIMDIPMTISD